MSKRFTETAKWDDPWFRRLPVAYKVLWEFLRDRCDNAGVWKKDIELANFFTGCVIDETEALKYLNDGKERVKPLGNNAWYLLDFIAFQYGELSEKCRPHEQVINILEAHKTKGYDIPYSLPLNKGKDRDKDKDKDKEYLFLEKEKEGGVGEGKENIEGGKTKKEKGEYTLFIEHAFKKFKEKTGEKLYFHGKKDGEIVKKLLGTYGFEKLKGLWDAFMQSDDPFIRKAGFSIGVFSTQINKLVCAKKAASEKPQVVL